MAGKNEQLIVNFGYVPSVKLLKWNCCYETVQIGTAMENFDMR